MKKSLLALAVLGAFAGVASAQTSVTIYGSFDGGLRNVTNTNAAAQSRFTEGSSGTYNSNRLGFRGVEDLGGGANAHFVLENGFNTGTGAVAGELFGRQAFVGLGGTWGSLDLGRQYTVAFKTVAAYDPFVYKYTGIVAAVSATAGVRYNNDVQYTSTPLFGNKVTVRAEYSLGENAGNTNLGSAQALGVSYNDGALSLGLAYTERNIAAVAGAVSGFDNKHTTVGGAYKFGGAKVYAAYTQEKQATATVETKTQYSWVGASYLFTPQLEGTYAYYQTKITAGVNNVGMGKKDMNIVGLTYALSKRTNLYGDVDFSKLAGVARIASTSTTPQTDQTGISFGINHLF